MEYKYDVFISYSRKDYVDENKQVINGNPVSAIKKVFDDNGITYWFDEEGIYSGQAFVEVLAEAISESKCFVFVCSNQSNESKWTRSEILEAFDADKTIIPFKIENVDYHKSLKFYLRQYDFISFFDNPSDALDELVRSVNKVKEDIEEQERKAFLEREKENIKREIESKSKDYLLQREQLLVTEKTIWEKENELGVSQKECPVCGRSADIMSSFCESCGWTFHFLSGISKEYDLVEPKVLTKLSTNWKLIDAYLETKKQVTKLNALLTSNEDKKRQLEEEKNKYSDELTSLRNEFDANKAETERLRTELKTKEDLLSSQEAKMQKLEEEKNKYSDELASLRDEFDVTKTETERLCVELKTKEDLLVSKETEIQKLEDDFKKSQMDYDSLNEELSKKQKQIEESQADYAALKQKYDECMKTIEEAKKREKEEKAKRLVEVEEKRKSFREFTVNGVTFKMIRVEGGRFQMGATEEQIDAFYCEKPVHSVTLSDYMIGETEVTQELWEAVMGNNPSKFKGAKNPVETVSWYDCKGFISELNSLTGQNFRLPTEAEWEFAARGGNKSKHYIYSGSNTLGDVAWYNYNGNSGGNSHPVGTKQANELGLYDMSGNVREWCEDWYYGDYKGSAQTNPKGPSQGHARVNRGGGWDCGPRFCRVSDRNYYDPSTHINGLGLRLAL